MAIIGVLTGAVALVISICVEKLVDLKYTQFDNGIWPASFLLVFCMQTLAAMN